MRAMESVVKKLVLFKGVTLEIEALTEYCGQGVCRMVELSGDTKDRYRIKLRTWTRRRKWRIDDNSEFRFAIKSKDFY